MKKYILAVEIGNSAIGCALFHEHRIAKRFSLPSDTDRSAHEYCNLLAEHLYEKGKSNAVQMMFLASVVPQLTDVVSQAMQILVPNTVPRVVNGHSSLNITVRPENKDELGSDIILNLAEVWERNNRRASIVVDFGTAVTVSAVDDEGVVCGVAIAPGVTTAMKSLTDATAQLPAIPLHFPEHVMGRDTLSAIQSGIMHGYCGLVSNLVHSFQQELQSASRTQSPPPPSRSEPMNDDAAQIAVVATGGDGEVMWKSIAQISAYVPELTLCGLYRLGSLNCAEPLSS